MSLMEFIRVFFNRKLILLTFAVLLMNCFVFILEQTRLYSDGDVTVFSVSETERDLVVEYKEMSISEAYELNERRINENNFFNIMNICSDKEHELYGFYKEMQQTLKNENPELARYYSQNKETLTPAYCLNRSYALKSFDSQLEYMLGYDSRFQQMESNIEKLKNSSVMLTEYALSDAEKTLEDYERIRNTELTFDCYRAEEAVFGYRLPVLFSLLLISAVLLSFSYEEKNGLKQTVRSTKNGRGRLELKRIGILFFASIVYPFLLYVSLLPAASRLFGGFGSPSASIQSSAMFSDVTYPLSFGAFFVLSLLLLSFGVFSFSLLARFILYSLRPFRMALTAIAALSLLQWTAYKYIEPQSIFAVFKYANFISALELPTDVLSYGNIPSGSFALNKNTLTVVFAVFSALVFSALCIFAVHKGAAHGGGCLTRRADRFIFLIKDGILCKGSLTFKELNKILLSQKGLLLFFIMLGLFVCTVDFTPVKYSAYDGIINEFYETYSGKTAEESREYLSVIENRISGLVSKGSFVSADIRYLTEAYGDVASYIEYLEDAEGAGYEVRVTDPRGYGHLFSSDYAKDRIIFNGAAVVFLVLILSDVFTFEEKNGVKGIISSTKNGRRRLFTAKLTAAVITAVALWIAVWGIQLLRIYRLFGIADLNIPVQSIMIFSDCPVSVDTGEYLALSLTARLLLLIAEAVFICFAGTAMKKEGAVSIVSLSILLLPEILSASELGFFDKLSFISCLDLPLSDGYGFVFILIGLAALCGLFYAGSRRGNMRGYFA